MGYVNESYAGPPKKFQCGTWKGGVYTPTWVDYSLPTTSKSQYGYRSGPLGPEEKAALDLRVAKGYTRWNQNQAIADLELASRDEAPGINPWMVNRRDYTELRCQPTEFYVSSEYGSGSNWNPTRSRGAVGIVGFNQSFLPAKPADTELRSWGERQLRAMRPTKPDFRLARFLGELRDVNKMFRPDSYFLERLSKSQNTKRNISGALAGTGAASLNYQFAVVPTVSDVKRGAEAIVNSDKIIRQYLQDMHTYVRRQGSREIESKTYTGLTGFTTVQPYNVTNGVCANMYVNGCPGTVHTDSYRSGLEGYLNLRLTQRVFSTYRYAPENSEGLLGVWDSYVGKAQKVIGLELNLQTVWDLLPFSWMADWFVDIGGLLGYQQDVADNKLAAMRSGYVLEWTGHGSVNLREAGANGTNTRNKRNDSNGMSTMLFKHQIREPGNPYGLSPSWDLNSFQWGILGSLGMAWGSGLPIFRK